MQVILQMKGTLFFLIFAFLFSASWAVICDSANGANTFNPGCSDEVEPYCVRVVSGPPSDVYECKQCISDCDCDTDQFCSEKPGEIGTCVDFVQEGEDCLPLDSAALGSLAFPEALKCASLYSSSGSNLQINYRGQCIEGTCRWCDWTSNSVQCGGGAGMGKPRRCAHPGYWTSAHSANWANGEYYENPPAVWDAIIFVFFLIFLLGAVVLCLVGCSRVSSTAKRMTDKMEMK